MRDLWARLTQRETDVLNLLVEGRTNKEIGLSLNVSPRTIEVHRGNIFQKLGAKNAADAVRIFFDLESTAPKPQLRQRLLDVLSMVEKQKDMALHLEYEAKAMARRYSQIEGNLRTIVRELETADSPGA